MLSRNSETNRKTDTSLIIIYIKYCSNSRVNEQNDMTLNVISSKFLGETMTFKLGFER